MDELVKLVSSKAGISQDQAKKAIETVMSFLKDKLPAPIASQVESALNSSKVPDVDGLGKTIGGMLGKKK